jgi:outer membrane protein OmpA-like peptidoglycan-associated protein
MTNRSYAPALLAAGALGLTGTCFLAPSLGRTSTATAESAPIQAETVVAVSQHAAPPPEVSAPPVVAAVPAPAAKPVMNAGRESACQAEFTKVVQEDPIDFPRDRWDLTSAAKAVLDDIGAVARACSGLKIEIQGHTDNQGRRRNNVSLSAKRAETVKQYLVEQGLSPDLLTAVGFGPDRPAASNRTNAGRTKNRRIEFRVSRVELE